MWGGLGWRIERQSVQHSFCPACAGPNSPRPITISVCGNHVAVFVRRCVTRASNDSVNSVDAELERDQSVAVALLLDATAVYSVIVVWGNSSKSAGARPRGFSEPNATKQLL